MATKPSQPVTKHDLKAFFKDVARYHRETLRHESEHLKDDLTAITKAVATDLHQDIDAVKEVHAETHAEAMERFDILEEKIDRVLLSTDVVELKARVTQLEKQVNVLRHA